LVKPGHGLGTQASPLQRVFSEVKKIVAVFERHHTSGVFRLTPAGVENHIERVGEWWSILILRDVFHGLTRFDQFQESLGIAPNMLARRLKALVEAGLLERRRYHERPPRDEYVLTQAGHDFRPVLWALLAWGYRHFAPEGPSVIIIEAKTGAEADPVLVDRKTGRPLVEPFFCSAAGPAADARTRRRHSPIAAQQSAAAPSTSP
jgi:DNA-binding HxlR family transcriptional regulator